MKKFLSLPSIGLTIRCAMVAAVMLILSAPASAIPNLVGHWQLEETNVGLPAVDSSGTNAAGTYGAGVNPDLTGPEGFGTGAHFAQLANTNINIGSGSVLNMQNDFSVAAWIKLGDTAGKHSIIGNPSWAVRSSGTALQITTFGVKDYTSTGGVLSAGGWNHVAVALDANNDAQFYVNGVDVGLVTHGAPANSNASDFAIGARTVGNAFEAFFGAIDDVRVYDGVLSQADVQTVMVDFNAPAFPEGRKLITPTSVTVNVGTEFFSADNLINNSGLSLGAGTDITNYESSTHAGSSGATSWTTDAAFPNYYDGLPAPVMTFELDELTLLSDLVTWNYSIPGNAARQVTVEFSEGGLAGTFGNAITLELPQDFDREQTLSFGGEILANAVRVTFDSNWAPGFGAGGDRVGLGEIKFIGAAPTVPEPATASLLLIGGAALLRRKRRMA